MTLQEFMIAKRYARPGYAKCFCPFHSDRSPSAILNPNNLYCFAEGVTYSLWDFSQAFGVILDRVNEDDSNFLQAIQGKPNYSYNSVLFTYPFQFSNFS